MGSMPLALFMVRMDVKGNRMFGLQDEETLKITKKNKSTSIASGIVRM